MYMNKAVFFDRDDCLVVDRDGYLHEKYKLQFFSDVPEVLAKIKQAGFVNVIITNQAAIAYGYYSIDDYQSFTEHMLTRLRFLTKREDIIDGVYFCPYHSDKQHVKTKSQERKVHFRKQYIADTDCRKPAIGMFKQASKELHIDLHKSWMVGDKQSDIEAGNAAGCKTILFNPLSHHTYGEDFRVSSFLEIAEVLGV